MVDFDYRLVYTDLGSYLALEEEISPKEPSSFWSDVRQGVAAVAAFVLTIFSYIK